MRQHFSGLHKTVSTEGRKTRDFATSLPVDNFPTVIPCVGV